MADRYLVLHTWGIGDMILLTPVLELIHEMYPNVKLDFAIFQATAMLPIKNAPYTGEIIRGSYKLNKLVPLISCLKAKKYDICITSSGISAIKAGLFAWLIRAKRRIGDAPAGTKRIYTDQITFDPSMHRTWANHALFKLVFDLPDAGSIATNPRYREVFRTRYHSIASAGVEAESFLKKHFATGDFVVAIHPGCNAKNKYRRWDLEYFVELVRLLKCRHAAWKFYVIAGPDELEEGTQLAKCIDAPCLSGVSLDTVSEALKRSKMLINTDSGIGHIASCHQLPSFVIFGPGDERQTAPFGNHAVVIRSEVPCAPCVQNRRTKCDTECLKKLLPHVVADVIKDHNPELQ